MFNTMIIKYQDSSAWERLPQATKNSYKSALTRIQTMGKKLKFENDMHKPVAVALGRSRSHIDFWDKAIIVAQVSNCERNKLVAMVKLVYRFNGLGSLVDGLKRHKHKRGDARPLKMADIETLCSERVPCELRLWANRVVFGFWTGMRPSEVRNLMWADVGETHIIVMGGKRKEAGVPSRMVRILPQVTECLEYAKAISSSHFVFVSESGKPLNKDVECRKVGELFDALGIQSVLYDARRGLATEMHKAGYGLVEIANQLGHEDIKTTQRYVRLTMAEKADSFSGFVR